MSEAFDPLHEWLGITSPAEQPNYYQLLGLNPAKTNTEAIKIAADRALAQVRSHRPGAHARQWAQLLDELTAAKQCLTDPEQRTVYDAELASGPQPATPSPAASRETETTSSSPTVDNNLLPPTQSHPTTTANSASSQENRRSESTPGPTPVAPVPAPTPPVNPGVAAPPVSTTGGYFAGAGPLAPAHLQATGLAMVNPMQAYAPHTFSTPTASAIDPVLATHSSSLPTYDAGQQNLATAIPTDSQVASKAVANRARQAFDRRILILVGLLLIGLVGTVVTIGLQDQKNATQLTSENQPPNKPAPSSQKPTQRPKQPTQPAVLPKPKPEQPESKPEQPKSKPDPEPDPKTKPDPEPKPKPDPKPEPPKPKPPTPLPPAELTALTAGLKSAREVLRNRDVKAALETLKKIEPLARFPEQRAAWERLEQLRFYAQAFDDQLRKAIRGLESGSEIKISASTILAVVEVNDTSITVRIAGQNRNYQIEELKPGIAVAIIKQSYDLNDANISAILGAYIGTLPTSDEEDLAKAAEYWQDAINKGAKLSELPTILEEKYEQLKANQ